MKKNKNKKLEDLSLETKNENYDEEKLDRSLSLNKSSIERRSA
ncbi:Uncharacterised protein [Chlamydia abortus]|nr:Uncharacterised protein [Chlamydia abortus]SGA28861.1 Uncharacterised protein [Chlamydia abortus]SGA30334.1 Uncharacterised protein [Chlamydia abortus]SGA30521.1 Uncharacterised protein [Chlamydia abortus]